MKLFANIRNDLGEEHQEAWIRRVVNDRSTFWTFRSPFTFKRNYICPVTLEIKKGRMCMVYKFGKWKWEKFPMPINPDGDCSIDSH